MIHSEKFIISHCEYMSNTYNKIQIHNLIPIFQSESERRAAIECALKIVLQYIEQNV